MAWHVSRCSYCRVYQELCCTLFSRSIPNCTPSRFRPQAFPTTAVQKPGNKGRRSIAVGVFNPPPRDESHGAGRFECLSRTLNTFQGPPVPAIFPNRGKHVFCILGPKIAQDRLKIAQDAPRTAQDRFKIAQDAPRTPPGPPKTDPPEPQKATTSARILHFLAFRAMSKQGSKMEWLKAG